MFREPFSSITTSRNVNRVDGATLFSTHGTFAAGCVAIGSNNDMLDSAEPSTLAQSSLSCVLKKTADSKNVLTGKL